MVSHKSKREIRFIKKENSLYPFLLREIADPPSGIYFLGELPDEKIPRLAIVGTRKATEAGKFLAKKVAEELTRAGISIVSGLAMGIDTASHEGAVRARGKTIAVLANGLDSIYPRQNENLARQILELGGAIISEYPPQTPAFQNQFLERNRIVSGLCLGTIIIEAPLHSGAIVTPRLAAEQGREVFVFPGPHNHPNYYGSHKLIRDGARLVTSTDDILEDLGLDSKITSSRNENQMSLESGDRNGTPEEKMILDVVRGAGKPLSIDKITGLSKLEPPIASQAVAYLVIKGLIKETERGYTI